jgi:thiol-disulfide isomerase/thioredoxin
MCKATGCRPCRQFRRKYGKLASHYSDAIFCEVVGDESESTRKMMRELKIRATPTFLFYRNGEMVHTHSGINAQKMVDALKQAVLFSEAGYCSEVKFAADLLMADVDGHH